MARIRFCTTTMSTTQRNRTSGTRQAGFGSGQLGFTLSFLFSPIPPCTFFGNRRRLFPHIGKIVCPSNTYWQALNFSEHADDIEEMTIQWTREQHESVKNAFLNIMYREQEVALLKALRLTKTEAKKRIQKAQQCGVPCDELLKRLDMIYSDPNRKSVDIVKLFQNTVGIPFEPGNIWRPAKTTSKK